MIKFYVILILVVVALLAVPSTRRAILAKVGLVDREHRRQAAESAKEQAARAGEVARAAAGAAREAAGTAAGVARGTAESVRGVGESVAQGITDRRLRILGRTFVIEADPETVHPVVTAAMQDAAVVDPVTATATESAAWRYSGTGDVRFSLVGTDRGTSVVGVTSWEYTLGEPQGVTTAGDVMGRIGNALTAAGLRWVETTRAFTPGPDDTSEGVRTLA